MKCFAILYLLVMPLASFAQIPIDDKTKRLKRDFAAIAPLPTGATFNVNLPEALSYLKSVEETRPYWSPFGLIINNKWDSKNPANYTFNMKLDGLKVLAVENEEIKSNLTVTGKEFLRHYIVSFPAELQVIDNGSKTVIKTVTITKQDDEFKRTFHRNIYITDTFDPNYKKVVGFDSLRQLQRISETDPRALKRIEGLFAEEIYEKMKSVLVHLYGTTSLKATLLIMNPKSKNRKYDFGDFDAASQKMEKSLDMLKENASDASAMSLLAEAEEFYSKYATITESRLEDYVPAMIYWNLSEINLVQGELTEAESYYEKYKSAAKPENYSLYREPYIVEFLDLLKFRKMVENGTVSEGAKKVERQPVKETNDSMGMTELSKGFIVTEQGDTVVGQVRNINSTLSKNHSVDFVYPDGRNVVFLADQIKAVSAAGIVYESHNYKFDGVFSGDQMMPGKKMYVLLYASPSIRVFFYRQAEEFIYFFPSSKSYKRYRPASMSDAEALVTNFNKKLSEVFASCPEVVKKIESGAYELKKRSSTGHILAVEDFENNCGSKSFAKYFLAISKENVMNKYR